MRKLRVGIAALFGFTGLLLLPATADGGVSWCAEDPILGFSNGTHLQLVVFYDVSHAAGVSGPVIWSVQVPLNAGPVVVTVPSNARHSEQVTLNYTGGKWGGGNNDLQIHATTSVRASNQFPLILGVNGDTSTSPAKGESNKSLTVSAHTHHGSFTPFQGVTTGTSYTFTGTGTVTLP